MAIDRGGANYPVVGNTSPKHCFNRNNQVVCIPLLKEVATTLINLFSSVIGT
jgi:hypothetical protein